MSSFSSVVAIRSQVGVPPRPVTTCPWPAWQRTMWSSKMAARWRGNDGLLNGNSGDFLSSSSRHEMLVSRGDVADLERSTQTCVDHSILAILQDSTVAPENKRGVDEENEKLLSALTEMLDSVEDDDGTLSPFDTLPESQLLVRSMEPLAERSPSLPVSVKSNGANGGERSIERYSSPPRFKQESQAENKVAENEVEVFTAASLVNLVRLMHPYCLKLHVGEGDGPKTSSRLFSGEVWRYEKPTEESDEEINVVSEDEAPQNKTEDDEPERRSGSNGQLLKSVLVKRNSSSAPSSKEKKRVSFGSVQVASFDESQQKRSTGENLTTGHIYETVSCPTNGSKALEAPLCSALEPKTASSEMSSAAAEAVAPRGETKAKALSLQQYRQLRQKRRPLVEKQGNCTTKWPSVSEPPKGLLPLPCLQGQRQSSSEPKIVLLHPQSTSASTDHPQKPASKTSSYHNTTPSRPKPSEAKLSCRIHRSGLKRPRTQSRIISPVSPLPDVTDNKAKVVPQSKRRLVVKATLVSSDPPNPVLLPLALSQQLTAALLDPSSEPKAQPDANLHSTRHLAAHQTESSEACPDRQAPSSQPKPPVVSPPLDSTALLQESRDGVSETSPDVPSPLCSSVTQTECEKVPTQECSLSPMHETKQEPQTPQSQSLDHDKVQNSTGESGIEAPDLTSLLEQFEETQAKEKSVCETNPEPKHVPVIPVPVTRDLDAPLTAPESTSRIPVELLGTSEPLRNLPGLQISEHERVPEALSTEIILSTQKDQPARRRNPQSKAIQIIDPRPLPPKKTHSSSLESPAKYSPSHLQSSVSSDHDYCGPLSRSLTQRSRAKPSSLKDVHILATVGELQLGSCGSSAAARSKAQTSGEEAESLCSQLKARPEAEPSPDEALLVSGRATGGGGAGKHQAAACTLPTPPPSPLSRGREKRRYGRRSPQSDSSCSSMSSLSSSSSSGSRSPKRQKLRHRRSGSSSCSSSCSRSASRSPPRRNRLPYSRSRASRSRSRSWSRSRSRSPSPRICGRRWRDVYSRDSRRLRREQEIRIQKLKAIDERRVVYVGRIRRSMTHSELRDRFSQFGEVECVSLHFRDRGDHYAFVTFFTMEDAFAAIDNGGKLRQPDELPFDICFGGRRQFCNSNYSDLDADRDTELSPAGSRLEDLDFDSLLKQAQRGVKR
ncbi:peroxisome proliferator-activated receptor gamma coactivator-related protein 1 isoform X2 [Betta splendens]|uniref:Peroxisome proliferator-activated receptor gamma coactivator-related protein 1 isoform X2 n=1 Tax=Betta splendens TaxID=158456 RepID=A0A6P7M5U0_BETSP|nr:peroxisome proliferator-activated receptor gamma coactivator-related protein 1 isoform X2 [Betta splendens]